jgi:hypothetical protein
VRHERSDQEGASLLAAFQLETEKGENRPMIDVGDNLEFPVCSFESGPILWLSCLIATARPVALATADKTIPQWPFKVFVVAML